MVVEVYLSNGCSWLDIINPNSINGFTRILIQQLVKLNQRKKILNPRKKKPNQRDRKLIYKGLYIIDYIY